MGAIHFSAQRIPTLYADSKKTCASSRMAELVDAEFSILRCLKDECEQISMTIHLSIKPFMCFVFGPQEPFAILISYSVTIYLLAGAFRFTKIRLPCFEVCVLWYVNVLADIVAIAFRSVSYIGRSPSAPVI